MEVMMAAGAVAMMVVVEVISKLRIVVVEECEYECDHADGVRLDYDSRRMQNVFPRLAAVLCTRVELLLFVLEMLF